MVSKTTWTGEVVLEEETGISEGIFLGTAPSNRYLNPQPIVFELCTY